ncbi:MAG: hypothetical protein JWM53_3220 [bacterium]|nr:hypothetical protein [bacterium]
MLLNALWSPEIQEQTSAYLTRSGPVTGTFLYGVGIMAALIFVGAVLASMRVSSEPPK